MYLSVLRQTGIHRKTGDWLALQRPFRTADEGIRKVWSAITELLRRERTGSGTDHGLV